MKLIETETSAATTISVPAELLASPVYANVRKAYARVADAVGGLPPFTVRLGKREETVETFDDLRAGALELAKQGLQITRFKGLGEMNEDELWKTTMDPVAPAADPRRRRGRLRRRPLVLAADGRPGRAAARVHRDERPRGEVPGRLMSELIPPTSGSRVEPRELEQEIRSSFLDYAMHVIVSRALPDVRDGLKPVHRRVLYSMYDNGLQPNRPTRKCARVVGDVMGSYHPHGDSAIYEALVRLAQPFSMRYPLVDGQGYFGSVDGDSAAAMRFGVLRCFFGLGFFLFFFFYLFFF